MKFYEKPEFELIVIDGADVICTSGKDPNYEYGGTGSDEDTGDHGGMFPASNYWGK